MSQSDSMNNVDFCELLFTKALAPYFRAVSKTNPNGFNSSAPAPGLWELYVYDQTNFRSATTRSIRATFVTAVQALGQHLHAIDAHDSVSNELSSQILAHIRSDKFTREQQQHFDMFFNIVNDSIRDNDGKAVAISIIDYKKNFNNKDAQFRVNVKTIIQGLDVAGAYSKNVSGLSQQGGMKLTEKLALITSYLPLVQPGDGLPGNAVVGTQVGGADEAETRAAILRILMEREYEEPNEQIGEVVVVSAEDIAKYLACVGEQATAPLSNTLTLAALPTNSWRKLSDGSYEKLTPQGYKPLSKEECEKVLSGTCAGSTLSSDVCQQFMAAVNSQNESKILELLGSQDVWDNNTAADSLNKLHPETVLRILKALKFGTKNGPFGKRVCTVDEWVSECIKGTSYASASASLSSNMRAYLEHLVNFVNSNPSLVDPSKRHNAAISSKETPDVLASRGIFYAGERSNQHAPKQLTFPQVQQAVQTNPFGFNPSAVSLYPTTAFGGAQPQSGGNSVLYAQAAQAQLSLGSGISHLVEQALNGLRSTHRRIDPTDEAKIRQKVANLTALEQEIYQNIMQLNELRISADSGVNCHSQLSSTQDRLMQLTSVYDRKAPCLQELCEQLRMLLAQQQNKIGYTPIE